MIVLKRMQLNCHYWRENTIPVVVLTNFYYPINIYSFQVTLDYCTLYKVNPSVYKMGFYFLENLWCCISGGVKYKGDEVNWLM